MRILNLGLVVVIMAYVVAVIVNEPHVSFDPGNGILDLFNYRDGGTFAHKKVPDFSVEGGCREKATTWWSPGQWYFLYLLQIFGMNLGWAIQIQVLLAVLIAVFGWRQCWRKWGFGDEVVLVAALVFLCSRYCYSQLAIYDGASILEVAFAPWLILSWNRITDGGLTWKYLLILPLIVVAYFVKSSLILLCLLMTSWEMWKVLRSNAGLKRIPILLSCFVVSKVVCDYLFVGEGSTPGSLRFLAWKELPSIDQFAQDVLFILSSPLWASGGFEDYVEYIFQYPALIGPYADGSGLILFIYLTVAGFFYWIWRKLMGLSFVKESDYLSLFVIGSLLYCSFGLFAYFGSLPISIQEESRHFRVIGLIFLPSLCQVGLLVRREIAVIVCSGLMMYGLSSSVSKILNSSARNSDLGIRLNMSSQEAWDWFVGEVSNSDYYYVINADWKFGLDPCRGFFGHDDFRSVQRIQDRSDVDLSGKRLVLLLPDRFEENGKLEAITSNFYGQSEPKSFRVDIEGYIGLSLVFQE